MTAFPTHDRQITPGRVASMSEHMNVAQIAASLRIDEEEVHTMLARAGRNRAPSFAAVCRRTDRRVTAYSERGAFLKAQLAGFAEYDFGPVTEVLS